MLNIFQVAGISQVLKLSHQQYCKLQQKGIRIIDFEIRIMLFAIKESNLFTRFINVLKSRNFSNINDIKGLQPLIVADFNVRILKQ
ncbi:hypothetical protein FGO68_gene17167 [Halteria grandinella]|uniref:Uncharacterized protein n=1 Tax=Halteria grandinella TaxID=5974 RepID=A0A8J8P0Q5_HALGN|nr:hypothetical protein FGO68_gene17167 [Halteria grandinella]